ncbi:two-component system sensor protein [Azoarcus sp. CIB]|uniref:sensor histidine kinase n=1 Tax=Aromatoleum sp. (strain CIB) TaxID=198107 RepID=UPI00067AF2A4|nr:HAMP domain-containing sensor histidine kinase [Azoarcus sp. CIB]AKU13425.1 two-component system sensor protein [Azoarcus sp. CIB]
MAAPQSLASRIVAAFVLMAAVVAGVFALIVVNAIDTVETRLVSDAMNRQLDFILKESDEGRFPALGPGLDLYVAPVGASASLPAWLAPLQEGLHETENDDEAYHVLVRDRSGTRHVLVLDQEDFERRETMLFVAVTAGVVISILAAALLGRALARTVISPVVRLSGQVQHRDQLLPLAPPLAAEYADDEVGKLAAAFDETLGSLRAALEREQLFTSDVSHELRTPLMVIASSCELLEAQGLAPPQRAQLDRITRACAEMQELVETFLGLARAPQERGTTLVGTSLAAVATEQLHRWQPEAAGRGLALDFVSESVDDGVYPAPLLRAVLTNLVRNAIHYTDKGFVRVVLRDGGFSVLDSGAGIPEAERALVFRPFARGGSTRGDGIGIGLSLVQRICDRQGWRITLSPREGCGCEFRVELRTS